MWCLAELFRAICRFVRRKEKSPGAGGQLAQGSRPAVAFRFHAAVARGSGDISSFWGIPPIRLGLLCASYPQKRREPLGTWELAGALASDPATY